MNDTLNSATQGVLTNTNFILAIGKDLLSFSRVSNISRTPEFDTVVEGGINTTVRLLTKSKQQQETLILEKGVNRSRIYDMDTYADLGLKVGEKIRQAVTLIVVGDKKYEDRYYGFNEGVVVKWEVGNLDALGREVFIERFEIAHSGLEELRKTDVAFRNEQGRGR
jgi:phage tail-like protein